MGVRKRGDEVGGHQEGIVVAEVVLPDRARAASIGLGPPTLRVARRGPRQFSGNKSRQSLAVTREPAALLFPWWFEFSSRKK